MKFLRTTFHRLACALGFLLLSGIEISFAAEANTKPRLLVLTDIGGDPDDQQSMIRLMVYANEFEIEGLIASASGTPGELKTNTVKPRLIREIVEAYGKVLKNLDRHAPGYPQAQDLLARIKPGNQNRGLQAIGEDKDTEGSRWIVTCGDKTDPRPLNIAIWGGQTDFAQALWRVRHDRGADGLKKFISRLRVHDIDDQDRIVEWIWEQFPGLFYILSKAPKGGDKREGAYRGMYLGGDESLTSGDWIDKNVRQSHGPLGALYPIKTWTAPNPHGVMKEGDTPSWFFFLQNGLNEPEHPEWGGWGGRFTNDLQHTYRDGKDRVGTVSEARATVWRWRPAFQADFQSRMDWCAAEKFSDANHPPVAVLNGDRSRSILKLEAKPGTRVQLSADGSSDPDRHGITASWYLYREAGTFDGEISLLNTNSMVTSFIAPGGRESKTVHVVLELRDDGKPSLASFRRAVVHIHP